MRISIIAAMTANRVIGRDNGLPWCLPTDMRRFKSVTMGHTVAMGRKTYDSIGRPLPGRTTVVITRRRDWRPPAAEGLRVVHSLDEAVRIGRENGDDEMFIAGGGEIFLEALPITDRIYLTRIEADIPGDAYFPQLDAAAWRLVEREHHDANEEDSFPFSFEVFDRP